MTAPAFRKVDIPYERSSEMLEVDGWAFLNTPLKATEEELKGVVPWDRARGMEVVDPDLGEPGLSPRATPLTRMRCASPVGAPSRRRG